MRCKHQNVTITEHILAKRKYIILGGQLADIATDAGQMPRQFDVACKDCGMQKTYRYGPGEFGPQSSPEWLYDHIEQVVCRNWKVQPAPERKRRA